MVDDDKLATKAFELFKTNLQSALQRQEAMSAFEHGALRPLYFLNGGALLAVMTFLGTVAAADHPSVTLNFGWTLAALATWAFGLFAAALAAAFGYLSQKQAQINQYSVIWAELADDKGDQDVARSIRETAGHAATLGSRRRSAAQWSGGASLLAFVVGSGCAVVALGVP